MNIYEGNGSIVIAVSGLEGIDDSYPDSYKGDAFVRIYVSAKNVGNDIAHVNPNDFTLSTPDGDTVSHDVDTYGLNNYFDAVDLRPGNHTSGWLSFRLHYSKQYTLNYQGFSGTATKDIAF